MRILGLDPGLARVGYGVLEVDEQRRNQPEMVDCGIISTDAGRSEGDRMVESLATCGSCCECTVRS